MFCEFKLLRRDGPAAERRREANEAREERGRLTQEAAEVAAAAAATREGDTDGEERSTDRGLEVSSASSGYFFCSPLKLTFPVLLSVSLV